MQTSSRMKKKRQRMKKDKRERSFLKKNKNRVLVDVCQYRRGNSARSMNNVRTTPTPKVTQTTIIPPYRCLFINRSADWVKPFLRSAVFPREEQTLATALFSMLRNREPILSSLSSLDTDLFIVRSRNSKREFCETGTRVLK